MRQIGVIGEEGREIRTESNAGGAGQRRHVDQELGLFLVGISERIGKDQTALGVGIVDLDGQALAAPIDVAGAEGIGRDRVFDDRDDNTQVDFQLGVHDHQGKPHDIRRAAHVFLHQQHGGGGLDVETAGVEADALADERHLAMALLAPAQLERRGASALARPTVWTSGKFCVSRSSPVITDISAL